MSKALNEARYALHKAQASSAYSLEIFGDHLAKKEGYGAHSGMDAIFYFLMKRHNWTPSLVRSMNYDDLSFALAEDIKGWTWPEEVKI